MTFLHRLRRLSLFSYPTIPHLVFPLCCCVAPVLYLCIFCWTLLLSSRPWLYHLLLLIA